jgi:hypothetical protein
MASLRNVDDHHSQCDFGQEQADNVKDVGSIFALCINLLVFSLTKSFKIQAAVFTNF